MVWVDQICPQTILDAIPRTIGRADLAARALGETPTGWHPAFRDLVRLFTRNDDGIIQILSSRLQNVARMGIKTIQRADMNTQRPGQGDVIIMCNIDRLIDLPLNSEGYKVDPLTGLWIGSESILFEEECGVSLDEFLDAQMPDEESIYPPRAVTAQANRGLAAGDPQLAVGAALIQLCEVEVGKGNNILDENKLRDALRSGASAAFRVYQEKHKLAPTPMDFLSTVESCLLHEFTHLYENGYATDGPEDDCYGWTKTLECQNADHADMMAYFALATELILAHGIAPTEEGEVQLILPPPV